MDTSLELLPLPAAHTRALNLLADADVEVSELAQVIESDAALTASILRGANSAASAPIERVDTANAAVMRLGLGHTRRMIVAAVMSSAFHHLHRAEVDADETWRHLVATALLTQAAMWVGGAPRGAVSEAFTAGMLHDLGRLSMATQDPGRYSLVATLARSGADVLEAEIRMFGVDHATWGAQVSEAWSIPETVAESVLHHHDGGGGELAQAVLAARETAWSLGIGDGVLTPDWVAFPEKPEHEQIVAELGGPDGLTRQIEWYRGALGNSRAVAA